MITPKLSAYLAIHMAQQNERLGIYYPTTPIQMLLKDYLSQFQQAESKLLSSTTYYVLFHAKRATFEQLVAQVEASEEELTTEKRNEIGKEIERLVNEAAALVEAMEELA